METDGQSDRAECGLEWLRPDRSGLGYDRRITLIDSLLAQASMLVKPQLSTLISQAILAPATVDGQSQSDIKEIPRD